MKVLSSILLVTFMSLSMFGFLGMLGFGANHNMEACIASLAQNGACPPPEHTLASALFHTDAFKVFSTTMPSSMSLLAALVLLVLSYFILRTPLWLRTRIITAVCNDVIEFLKIKCTSLFRLRALLARFELSPSSL